MLITEETGEGRAVARSALSASAAIRVLAMTSAVLMVSGMSSSKMKVTDVVLETEDIPGRDSENSSTVVCDTLERAPRNNKNGVYK
jgi:hypothetical protein